jgi:outer membrane protein with beta-barrel domain
MKNSIAAAVLLFSAPLLVLAQQTSPKYSAQGYLVLGVGDGDHARSTFHAGGGGEVFLYKGLGFGAEADYAHGSALGWANSMWIGSGNLTYHFGRKAKRGKADPFVALGPSGFFPASEGRGTVAVNLGAGVNIWLRQHTGLRLEVRNFVNAGSAANGWPRHVIAVRFGVTFR